jgi:transposase
MAKAPKPFSLPDEAKRSLTTMLGKGIHPARKLTRARILLKLSEGSRPLHVARELDVAENTVYNVRNKAEKHGWQAAIEDETRSGRPPEISREARAQITALACSKPPTGHGQWSLRLLRDKAVELGFVEEISHVWVREILKKTRSSRT